ncbi:MAG: penicillin-binding protein 2 [Microcoleaceae cyanobacterium]
MVRQLSVPSETSPQEYPQLQAQLPRKIDSMAMWRRGILLMLITTGLIGLHLYRLVNLQLLNGQQNRLYADENRIRLVPIPSKRGEILDRHNKPLATNKMTRVVYAWPKVQTPKHWQSSARQLSPILGMPASTIVDKIEKRGYQTAIPVRLSQNLTPEAFVWLAEKKNQFPGLEIQTEFNRTYPQGDLASHVIGYIGEANQADLEAHPEYPMGMIIGQLGIEAGADEQIAGVWGARLIEVDADNKELRLLGEKTAQSGEIVNLTLDSTLQKTAEQALGNRKGAAVVLNVNTGEVLAMASRPGFDPNLFTKPISASTWESLQQEDNPFLNRTLQGYPPGSTFKIVSSAAGMGSGKFSPYDAIATASSIVVGNMTFHEHSGGYGVIGFRTALAFSSNTFFYRLGLAIGADELAKWASRLGIGSTDLDLLRLTEGSTGFVPTPANKEEVYGEPWYLGDTVTMSIGQGAVLATPLELAVMVSSIANGGKRVQPHLLASLTNTAATAPISTGLSPEAVETIQDGLISVVQYGTAQLMNDGTIPLTAGKTGTSEVLWKRSHSLFVAFGPVDKPEIGIAVVVEHGGYGSKAAAPVAKQIFQTYFSQKR